MIYIIQFVLVVIPPYAGKGHQIASSLLLYRGAIDVDTSATNTSFVPLYVLDIKFSKCRLELYYYGRNIPVLS